jgi:hypothetical protein
MRSVPSEVASIVNKNYPRWTCAYATLSYEHYKNTYILPIFEANFWYYKRFGLLVPNSQHKNNEKRQQFRGVINN